MCSKLHFQKEVIPLSQYFGHYIRILHSTTDQAMTAALASMDLTAAQGHILAFISHRETPPCSRDIEEKFQLSHPTVSGLLSRLERKGFIEFRPDEADRRCKRIYILEKGQQVHELIHRTIRTAEEQLVKDFTEEEKEQFSRLLLRAISNVGISPCKRRSKEESTK